MLTVFRHVQQKPPPGILKLDPGHPLTQGLKQAWLFNDMGNAVPWDAAGLRAAASMTGFAWASTAEGPSIQANSTTPVVDVGRTISSASGTVAVRYWPTMAWNSNTARMLWGQESGGGTPEFSAQHFSDNNLYIGWNNASGDFRVLVAASASNWVQNAWQTYTLTWGPGGSVLYWNATQIGTHTVPTTTVATQTFRWGLSDPSFPPPAVGDGYSYGYIYDRVLSAAEVAELVAEPYAILQARPTQLWSVPSLPPAVGAIPQLYAPVYRATAGWPSGWRS